MALFLRLNVACDYPPRYATLLHAASQWGLASSSYVVRNEERT